MKLPVKITPDRIRDSIVQVFFQSDIPFEPLIGFCYSSLLTGGWRYANRHPINLPGQPVLLEIPTATQHFFIKDQVKMQILTNQSLVFNCLNSYIGWRSYFPYIQAVVTDLFDAGHIRKYSRVGIRYISEFPDTDILDKIEFYIRMPNVKGDIINSNHRIALEEDGFLTTINIANKIPINVSLGNMNVDAKSVSLLDVDIVQDKLSVTNPQDLIQIIDNIHNVEKQAFFGLLKEDFLQSLNPVYN